MPGRADDLTVKRLQWHLANKPKWGRPSMLQKAREKYRAQREIQRRLRASESIEEIERRVKQECEQWTSS